jgi:hypothetical protein
MFEDTLNELGIRQPDDVQGTNTTTTVTWNVDLTPSELAIVTDVVGSAKSKIPYDLYVDIKDELPVLRSFMQTASPTNAQQTTAVKSIIRVIRAVIKD